MSDKVVISVTGMDCASCVINLDGVLEDVAGIAKAQSSYSKERVTVVFNPVLITTAKIVTLIENLGYGAVVTDLKRSSL